MLTILTVDDSPTIRRLLAGTLGGFGYQVEQAEDGVAALEKLQERKPDLVITDINMPRLDGFGLISAIRAEDRLAGMPILVLTTESSEEKKAQARAAGATGWIVKPFDPVKLDTAIRRVVG